MADVSPYALTWINKWRQCGGDAGNPVREIAEEARNRIGASNDHYEPAIQGFNADAGRRQQLQHAMSDFHDQWNHTLGTPTPLNNDLRKNVEVFAREVTHQGDGIARPRMKIAYDKVTDADGAVTHVRRPPEPYLKTDGTPEQQWIKRGDVVESVPYDDLGSVIDARSSLNREITKAQRSDPGLVPQLMQVKRSLDDRLRAVAPEWAHVNDTKAGAHALERSYRYGLSLNVNASRAGLIDLERTIAR